MKWYQPFECDNTVANPLVCDSDNLSEHGYSEDDFFAGNPIASWCKDIFFRADDNGDPDDVLQNHLMVPIFSPQLIRSLVQNEIKGIQFLPISVIKHDNVVIAGFCIANFLNFIEAFCFDKSDYFVFQEDFPNPAVRGTIAGVSKFVLKANRLVGMDVIRLKEYERRFFVSHKFKDVFQRNGFTGYSFKAVELV